MKKCDNGLPAYALVFFFCLASACYGDSRPDLAVEAVSRVHCEISERAEHAFTIRTDGSSPLDNRSVQIEVLEGTCRNPSLKSSGNIDFSSLRSIVDGVVSQGMTDEAKALALWRFVMNTCYHGPWGTSSDGLEHLTVYGYGYCGTFADVLEPLWWAAGLKGRHINTGNHAATEAYYDHDWHYIDAHQRSFFLAKNNTTIASLDEMNTIPELWDANRTFQSGQKGYKKNYYMSMHPVAGGRSPQYTNRFAMAKGDILTLSWQKAGKWCLTRGDEGGNAPAPEPPVYANGTFRFYRDLLDPGQNTEGLISSENIDWKNLASGYLHPAVAKKEAYLIYRIRVPYFIPEASVKGAFLCKEGSSVGIDISVDNGKSWAELWNARETGLVHAEAHTTETQKVTMYVPWKYSFLIRVRMFAEKSHLDVGGYHLESTADLFYNPKGLPQLKPGSNEIVFRAEEDSQCAVRVTYSWLESLPLSVSNEHPLEGEQVTLQARVRNNGNVTVKDVPVVFSLGLPGKGSTEIGRSLIKGIDSGGIGYASISWRATRTYPEGTLVSVAVEPQGKVGREAGSHGQNNTFSRLISVLNPPDVRVPSEGFLSFERKKDDPRTITIKAAVRNLNGSPGYGLYLSDHATAEDVVVKFFDGEPGKGKQIGPDQRIGRLLPLEFKTASVDWNVSQLVGFHTVYAEVYTPFNVVRALGRQTIHQTSARIDLDAFRKCVSTR